MPKHSAFGRTNRRQFLFGTAAAPTGTDGAFLTVSNLLVNHDLDPALSARIAAFAAAKYPEMGAMMGQITAAVAAKDATRVEDFFDNLPEGPTKDFAYWVIETWYTGSSSPERDATLFTYEEALLYRPTLDMVPIPTFGLSAPNAWGRDLYPLAALPQF